MGRKEPLTHGLVYHCLTNMGWSTWFPLRGNHSGWWLVSGLYWGLYDRLWESLATSNYKHCSSGSGNSWGFVMFFWVDVCCFSNGWSSCVIELGEDWRHLEGGPGMRSHQHRFFFCQGVSKFYISGSFPNTSGEYMLRISEDGKMVIGPSMWSEDDRNADIYPLVN